MDLYSRLANDTGLNRCVVKTLMYYIMYMPHIAGPENNEPETVYRYYLDKLNGYKEE